MKRRITKKQLIPLTSANASALRKRLYKKQNKCCAILKEPIPFNESVLDHKHKTKDQKAGPCNRGLIRGVLHFRINSFEAKVLSSYKRQGLNQYIYLPTLLRNLADYLENPPCKQIYIHPNEREKVKKLSKVDYKRIVKYYKILYPNKKKIPEYPKSGKETEKWKKLLKKVNKLHFKKK